MVASWRDNRCGVLSGSNVLLPRPPAVMTRGSAPLGNGNSMMKSHRTSSSRRRWRAISRSFMGLAVVVVILAGIMEAGGVFSQSQLTQSEIEEIRREWGGEYLPSHRPQHAAKTPTSEVPYLAQNESTQVLDSTKLPRVVVKLLPVPPPVAGFRPSGVSSPRLPSRSDIHRIRIARQRRHGGGSLLYRALRGGHGSKDHLPLRVQMLEATIGEY
jgi:hypothetical protein